MIRSFIFFNFPFLDKDKVCIDGSLCSVFEKGLV
jgi:hypothetical protein